RGGNTEVGADPVAHVRLHGAAELFDRARHSAHAFADECLNLVGTQALTETGRAHDVGEKCRDGPHLVAGRWNHPRGILAAHQVRCRTSRGNVMLPGVWMLMAEFATLGRRHCAVLGSKEYASG